MSTNIVESIGYTVERIHSGLLGHLFKDGHDPEHGKAAKLILDALGVGAHYGSIGNAVAEWKNIDLVLTSQDTKTPIVAFEFKVDSREGRRRDKPQMQTYEELLKGEPEKVPLFYVTLGLSGVHREQSEQRERVGTWIDLARFLEAVQPTSTLGHVYGDWIEALSHELARRNAFEHDLLPETDDNFRSGSWNSYLMACLRGRLVKSDPTGPWTRSTIYTLGQKPDTIWHFGELLGRKAYVYAEVNSNGKLNLKIKFGEIPKASREQIFNDERAELETKLRGFAFKPNKLGGFDGKTKTLLSVNVGLRGGSRFRFCESRDHLLKRLRDVAKILFVPS